MSAPASLAQRLNRAVLATLSLTAAAAASAVTLLPQAVSARPWPRTQVDAQGYTPSYSQGYSQEYPAAAPQNRWWGPAYGNGYQAYGAPPLTPEQQIQRCNTGRLIGGLGGGAVAYAISRDEGRSWAIPLGALLGSQVGCNAAAGRGPLPW